MKTNESKRDFLENELPINRFKQFFDCIKIRYDLLIKIALLTLLFSLPLLATLFFKDAYIITLESSLSSGEIDESSFNEMYKMINRIAYLICIPCFVILFLGLAGSNRVIKQMAIGEGVFFRLDFFEGIKMNAKHYIIYSLIFSLLFYLSNMAYLLDINIVILKILPIVISVIVFLPIILYGLIQTQFYSSSLFKEIKNSFILFIKTFLFSILASIVTALPLLFSLINLFFFKMLFMILYVIIVFPFVILGDFLYFYSQLDKYINKNKYPEFYKKGLAKEYKKDE